MANKYLRDLPLWPLGTPLPVDGVALFYDPNTDQEYGLVPQQFAGGFVNIAANAYGTHPAFSTQRELDIWLLQHSGTSAPGNGSTLAAPASPSATAISTSSLSLAASSVVNATGYLLFRSTSSGGTYTQVGGTLSTPAFADTGLSAATTYYYKWQALGNGSTYLTSALGTAFAGTTQASGGGSTSSITFNAVTVE